jgi:DNA modification methylase
MKTEKLSDTITIINADCREWSGVADAVVTDPPYGLGERMDSGTGEWSRCWGESAPEWDRQTAEGVVEMISTFPTAIVWGGNYYAFPPMRGWLIWDKMQEHSSGHAELAWTNIDIPIRTFRLSRVQAYSRMWKEHPTQKPIELMLWCLQWVPSNAIVLDPYMGSGTTGIACIRTNRRFVGIEKDEQHYQTARQRLLNELAQTNLFGQDEDARAGQGECPGTACNSGRDAMPLDIFEGIQ